MRSSLYGPGRSASPAPPSADGHSSSGGNRNDSAVYRAEMEEQARRENKAMLGALGSSVQRMKAMAGDLNREVEEQNELLVGLRAAFDTATRGVHSSVRGVKGVMAKYGYRHTALFGLAIFLVLYVLYRLLTRSSS